MRNVSLKVLVKSLKFLFKKGYEPCLPSFPDPPLFPPYPLPLSMPALQAMARSSKYRDITTVNTLIIPATATSLAKIAGVLCFIAIRD